MELARRVPSCLLRASLTLPPAQGLLHCHGAVPLHGHMPTGAKHLSLCRSALFGVASTLRKLGQYAEALDKYERLCQLSSKLNIVGSKPNW